MNIEIRASNSRIAKLASPSRFSGSVYLDALVAATGPSRLNATTVTFPPGARTAWHSHDFRQVLLVTVGTGFVQVRGEPAHPIHPGDVVEIPPEVVHWHGAAPGSLFAHLALLESDEAGTTWLDHVADAHYAAATR